MIRHIVMWQLASADPVERAEQGVEIRRRLTGLLGVVPGLEKLEVGLDVGAIESNWHVVLVSEHSDLEALAGYAGHPAHVEAGGYIKSVAAERACVDFEF